MAESFRKCFKKSSSEFFLKYNFEVVPFCSSRYSDKNSNAVSRLVNTFIQALNLKFYLPEYFIMFLDDDLIEYLQYKKYAMASLLGPWLKYITEVFTDSVNQKWDQLTVKARLLSRSQLYWVEPVLHDNFNYSNKQVCEILGQCLEANCKLYEHMCVLKIRENWDRMNDNYVMNNSFMKLG